MEITILDLTAYIGLIAVGAITINMLLGVMMAFRYSPSATGRTAASTISASTTGPATSP